MIADQDNNEKLSTQIYLLKYWDLNKEWILQKNCWCESIYDGKIAKINHRKSKVVYSTSPGLRRAVKNRILSKMW